MLKDFFYGGVVRNTGSALRFIQSSRYKYQIFEYVLKVLFEYFSVIVNM